MLAPHFEAACLASRVLTTESIVKRKFNGLWPLIEYGISDDVAGCRHRNDEIKGGDNHARMDKYAGDLPWFFGPGLT